MSRYLLSLLSAASLLLAALAHAGPEVSANAEGQVIQGYDPVAYFTTGEPTQGDPQFSAEYQDATYLFASAENRDMFLSDPEKYAPQYGGYCAFGTSLGKKFDGDPMFWKIVDGKLYLNSGEKPHTMWSEDISGRIQQADTQWPDIRSKTAAELN